MLKGIKRNITSYQCLFFTMYLLFTFFVVITIISADLFISFSFLVKQANYMFVFTLMVPLLLMKFHKLTHGVVLCSAAAAMLLWSGEQKTVNKFSIQYFYHAVIFSNGLQTVTKLKNERIKKSNLLFIYTVNSFPFQARITFKCNIRTIWIIFMQCSQLQ